MEKKVKYKGEIYILWSDNTEKGTCSLLPEDTEKDAICLWVWDLIEVPSSDVEYI